MRKAITIIGNFFLLLVLLAGCSNSSNSEVNESATVTFWIFNNPPMVEMTKKLVAEYQEQNKNVKIDLQVMPNEQYFEKYLVALGTETGPDILLISDRSIPTLVTKQVVAPVEPKAFGFDDIEDLKAEWMNGSLDGLESEGQIYGIPMEFNTFSLYLNKKAFEAAGLDPKKDVPKTWDELAEVAKKLTIYENGKLVQSGFAWPMFNGGWDALIMDPMVRQLGGKFIEDYGAKAFFTSPEVKKVYQTWYDMYNLHKTSEVGFGTSAPSNPNQSFLDGSVAMWISGPWAIPQITEETKVFDNYEVVPLPQYDANNPVTLLYSWNWSVNSKTKYPKQAWNIVNFLSSKQKEWLDTAGYIQPRKGWMDDADVQKFPFMNVWQQDMEKGNYILRSDKYAQLTDIIGRSVDAVMKENVPIDEALKTAQEEAEKVLTQ